LATTACCRSPLKRDGTARPIDDFFSALAADQGDRSVGNETRRNRGLEVAAKLREEHGDALFLIALTGYAKGEERLHAAGFDEHLLKPPDLDSLLDLLAEGGPVDKKLRKGS
jgi:CheY-like chemotaxis protein